MKGLFAWTLALALAPLPGAAQCRREVQVPVAPLGLSLVVQGNQVAGVYPAWLERVGQRTQCRFRFEVVPRARLNQMFDLGQADLMIPATRTAARDALGPFVPLIRMRPALISLKQAELPALASLDELLRQRELRVVVVRGFDLGPAYREALTQLQREGRLVLEAEPAGVARALQLALADLTIMPPQVFVGTLAHDDRLRPMLEQLKLQTVDELPWSESGVYLSRRRLPAAELQALEQAFVAARPWVWELYHQHYPTDSLSGSIAPVP